MAVNPKYRYGKELSQKRVTKKEFRPCARTKGKLLAPPNQNISPNTTKLSGESLCSKICKISNQIVWIVYICEEFQGNQFRSADLPNIIK